MDIERKTLYNLLRMNWLRDPSGSVNKWQVEDYRSLSMDNLFSSLEEQRVFLDRVSFQALADDLESPEELTDYLIADLLIEAEEQDKIYLCVFELWRRLVPEKLSLTVFCDELDYQIDLYDRGQLTDVEELQDILANFAVILDENTDEVGDPKEVFQSISSKCANDIENFLYDFISEQLDNKNLTYASELLDDFVIYVKDARWFEFLQARLTSFSDASKANADIKQIMHNSKPDLDFNLEVLFFLIQCGDKELFKNVLKKTIPCLVVEEDFQEVLAICADYLHRLDYEQKENEVNAIVNKRSKIDLEKPLNKNDAQISELLKIVL